MNFLDAKTFALQTCHSHDWFPKILVTDTTIEHYVLLIIFVNYYLVADPCIANQAVVGV